MAGRIYVIVPVFNRKSFTEHFLLCMRKQSFRNFETIVVDDGSTDGTAELISEQFKEVHLLRGDGNLWWTGAINLGIRHALAGASDDDSVLVINDDLEINPDYLEKLYGAWTSTPGTLIGSLAVDVEHPELIVEGGRIVNWWTAKGTILNSGRPVSEFPKHHCADVSSLTGWGTLIPVPVFREIGLYDDRHFQQCGDTEFPVRARNAGYRLIVSYDAVVKAHVRASADINTADTYSFGDIRNYFFAIKSNCRLRYRLFFALKTARNPVAFLSFLIFDLLRITTHLVLRLRLSQDKRSSSG
jgi:N-acetylglucosaminyl-diphospho-decaprenol L-rhamnosyltransferase